MKGALDEAVQVDDRHDSLVGGCRGDPFWLAIGQIVRPGIITRILGLRPPRRPVSVGRSTAATVSGHTHPWASDGSKEDPTLLAITLLGYVISGRLLVSVAIITILIIAVVTFAARRRP